MHTSVRDLLASRGLRCTTQRELLYSTLMASKLHPTAEELHSAVNLAAPADPISLATVYNTLDALASHGLVRRIAPTKSGADAAFRYDADTSNHAHVLLADGTLCDLPEELSVRILSHLPAELIAEVERSAGVKIRRISVEFEAGGPRLGNHG